MLIAMLLLTSTSLMSHPPHKHYISLTQIDYKENEKALQVTMRFFIDDLEKAVGSRFDKNLQLATPDEMKDADLYIERYLAPKFNVWVNGKELAPSYLGKQYEDDQVFFFLEIVDIEEIEVIEIQNNVLMEVYEEQQNYVKLRIGDVSKTFILVKANDKEMLKIPSSD